MPEKVYIPCISTLHRHACTQYSSTLAHTHLQYHYTPSSRLCPYNNEQDTRKYTIYCTTCMCTHTHIHTSQAKAPGATVVIVGTHLDLVLKDRDQKCRRWADKLEKYKFGRKGCKTYPQLKAIHFVGCPEKKRIEVDKLNDILYDIALDMDAPRGKLSGVTCADKGLNINFMSLISFSSLLLPLSLSLFPPSLPFPLPSLSPSLPFLSLSLPPSLPSLSFLPLPLPLPLFLFPPSLPSLPFSSSILFPWQT